MTAVNIRTFVTLVDVKTRIRLVALGIGIALAVAACGSGGSGTSGAPAVTTSQAATADDATQATGVRAVTPADAAVIQQNPPDDLVILDVRTSDEFATGHLEGATMIDFYSPDFAERIAALDRDVPYLLYCRSGNRSGQARQLMSELGFVDVADIDGGITAWAAAGLPLVG